MMEMKPLNSSNLKAVGFDDGTLIIEFTNNTKYSYKNVPRHVYDELLAAPSHGKFFHAHIRNVYEVTKL
jgi:hypothetical protein